VRAFYAIGKAMFGKVPTTERIMAHRPPLMMGLGALYGSLEWLCSPVALPGFSRTRDFRR
jgi:hypothetical protein